MSKEWKKQINALDDFGRYRLAKTPGLAREAFVQLMAWNRELTVQGLPEEEMLKRGIAENYDAPLDILIELARDPHPGVRLAVISCHMEARSDGQEPRSDKLFELLLRDPEFMVRQEIALNPATPGEYLFELAHDDDDNIRLALVANASSPAELLKYLSEKDPNPANRKAAAAAIRLRQRYA